MTMVKLAEAKARLSELVRRSEAGETIEITNRGRVAARLVPPVAHKMPIDFAELRQLRASMPVQQQSAASLIRKMRDEGF